MQLARTRLSPIVACLLALIWRDSGHPKRYGTQDSPKLTNRVFQHSLWSSKPNSFNFWIYTHTGIVTLQTIAKLSSVSEPLRTHKKFSRLSSRTRLVSKSWIRIWNRRPTRRLCRSPSSCSRRTLLRVVVSLASVTPLARRSGARIMACKWLTVISLVLYSTLVDRMCSTMYVFLSIFLGLWLIWLPLTAVYSYVLLYCALSLSRR